MCNDHENRLIKVSMPEGQLGDDVETPDMTEAGKIISVKGAVNCSSRCAAQDVYSEDA